MGAQDQPVNPRRSLAQEKCASSAAAVPPLLTVVIPTLGRPILIDTLKSLVACASPPELDIIVAGRILDKQVAGAFERLQAEWPQIRHLSVAFESGDSSRKKNAGLHAARSEIVAFLDDDVVVAKDWPAQISSPFGDPAVGLVSGPSLVPEDLPLVARLAGLALASKAAGYVAERYLTGESGPREVRWSRLIGCNMAYRRSVIESIGGFNPQFWPGEEMLAAYQATRQGQKLVFNPAAFVYHFPRCSLSGFIRQIYTYGATRVRLMRAGVEVEVTTMLPAVWVLSLAALGVPAAWSPLAAWLLLADLGLYAVSDLAVTLMKVRETGRFSDGLLFFLIPVMHFSYGLGQWIEVFRPDKDFSRGERARLGP